MQETSTLQLCEVCACSAQANAFALAGLVLVLLYTQPYICIACLLLSVVFRCVSPRTAQARTWLASASW